MYQRAPFEEWLTEAMLDWQSALQRLCLKNQPEWEQWDACAMYPFIRI
jgi:hypothetical protein